VETEEEGGLLGVEQSFVTVDSVGNSVGMGGGDADAGAGAGGVDGSIVESDDEGEDTWLSAASPPPTVHTGAHTGGYSEAALRFIKGGSSPIPHAHSMPSTSSTKESKAGVGGVGGVGCVGGTEADDDEDFFEDLSGANAPKFNPAKDLLARVEGAVTIMPQLSNDAKHLEKYCWLQSDERDVDLPPVQQVEIRMNLQDVRGIHFDSSMVRGVCCVCCCTFVCVCVCVCLCLYARHFRLPSSHTNFPTRLLSPPLLRPYALMYMLLSHHPTIPPSHRPTSW
jgi:hypothetical protein